MAWQWHLHMNQWWGWKGTQMMIGRHIASQCGSKDDPVDFRDIVPHLFPGWVKLQKKRDLEKRVNALPLDLRQLHPAKTIEVLERIANNRTLVNG